MNKEEAKEFYQSFLEQIKEYFVVGFQFRIKNNKSSGHQPEAENGVPCLDSRPWLNRKRVEKSHTKIIAKITEPT